MTIPEAVQLVLQAGALGKGGEVFVLDMGEPLKIVDLANDLIRLSGLEVGDIEIRFSWDAARREAVRGTVLQFGERGADESPEGTTRQERRPSRRGRRRGRPAAG